VALARGLDGLEAKDFVRARRLFVARDLFRGGEVENHDYSGHVEWDASRSTCFAP
jgi:hypothetical protein